MIYKNTTPNAIVV